MAALEQAQIEPRDMAFFAHGSTVGTNALITRRLPRTAVVASEGFRDVHEIRRGTKPDLWDAYSDVAPPYVRRRDRFEVPERIDYAGTVLTELDEDAAREVARRIKERGYESVAVTFINAYMNGEHEARMKAIIEEEAPGVFVCTSHEILPEVFEHERFSTTIINACLAPVVSRYLANLTDRLRDGDYQGDVLVLHSGGGVMTAEAISRNAARIAVSGPAAGAMAGAFFARQCGFDNAISLDMGGTSADISLMYGGEVRVANEWSVEFGYPIMFPSIEIVTIGAGGGSVAWIDAGGSLRNGPQSMGADPGPAAYQRGGEEATNTDANLVLGRLSPAGPPRRRHAARPGGRRAGRHREDREAARLRRRSRRRRHHPGGQREHGRCRPPHLDPPRLRPARLLPRRLRRRGLGPRRPPGARTRHPGGRRSALPGDHLGARLPPPRRAARPLPHLPHLGRQGEQRRAGSGVRQRWKTRRGSAWRSRGSRTTASNCVASWTCATSGSGAR